MIGHLYCTVIDCPDPKAAIDGRRLPGQGEGFRVYADPAGHPFCLVFGLESTHAHWRDRGSVRECADSH